jgi:hypothetical protein
MTNISVDKTKIPNLLSKKGGSTALWLIKTSKTLQVVEFLLRKINMPYIRISELQKVLSENSILVFCKIARIAFYDTAN